jgi:hypothetical protein
MSTGPSDLIPSYCSADEAAETRNIRIQRATEASAASCGATISRNRAPSSNTPPAFIIASRPSCSSAVVPHG